MVESYFLCCSSFARRCRGFGSSRGNLRFLWRQKVRRMVWQLWCWNMSRHLLWRIQHLKPKDRLGFQIDGSGKRICRAWQMLWLCLWQCDKDLKAMGWAVLKVCPSDAARFRCWAVLSSFLVGRQAVIWVRKDRLGHRVEIGSWWPQWKNWWRLCRCCRGLDLKRGLCC